MLLNELIYQRIPLSPLSGDVFDRFMAEGWRLLGDSLLRHNSILIDDERILTIPLRIKVPGLAWSKSQKKAWRKHQARFTHRIGQIRLTPEKERLFLKHSSRFRLIGDDPALHLFLTQQSAILPVPGWEIEVFEAGQLVACSYFHIGEQSMCATYCYFDPAVTQCSLGTYTMLLELEVAKQLNKDFYYPGYVHSVSSQFDYKLNFNNLEEYEWTMNRWFARPRRPITPAE